MNRFKKNRPSVIEGIIEKQCGRMMRNMSSPGRNTSYFSAWEPAVDVYQSDNNLIIYIDVSGVPEAAVKFVVEERRLIISGERQCTVDNITEVHQLENEYGPFERIIELPIMVDRSSITSENSNGFLVVHLQALT